MYKIVTWDSELSQQIERDATPEEIVEIEARRILPAPIPQTISRAQGKAALIKAGVWEAVLAYTAAITDPIQKALAEVALNDTQDWQRNSPFLNTAATELGLTAGQLDELFIAAAKEKL